MAKHPLIWLTRPKADSASFAEVLSHDGIQSMIAPVLHTVPQPLSSSPSLPDAILLTSRHAAHVLASLPSAWHALPVYCVGGSTANVATEHGCTHIIAGGSNVLALLPRIASDLGDGAELLYFAGEDTSVDVVHLLAMHGVKVSTHIVYHAVAEHALSSELVEALATGRVTGVAFFSPRSAQIAYTLLQAANLAETAKTIDAFCFSMNVAAAAAKCAWRSIYTCHLPTRSSMHELIVSHTVKPL